MMRRGELSGGGGKDRTTTVNHGCRDMETAVKMRSASLILRRCQIQLNGRPIATVSIRLSKTRFGQFPKLASGSLLCCLNCAIDFARCRFRHA
jgi:hypothetical protein